MTAHTPFQMKKPVRILSIASLAWMTALTSLSACSSDSGERVYRKRGEKPAQVVDPGAAHGKQKLPAGHPPMGATQQDGLPKGHPPMAGTPDAQMPVGHPPMGMGSMVAAQAKPLGEKIDKHPALQWELPSGWSAHAGSGMRLLTFAHPQKKWQVSVISLSGKAGGVEANIQRWAGQLGMDWDTQRTQTFVAQQEKFKIRSGEEGLLVDFSKAIPDGSKTSMLAAMVPMGEQVLFLKMTDTPENIRSAQKDFSRLCKSLAPPKGEKAAKPSMGITQGRGISQDKWRS
jgi:hypothetical protein